MTAIKLSPKMAAVAQITAPEATIINAAFEDYGFDEGTFHGCSARRSTPIFQGGCEHATVTIPSGPLVPDSDLLYVSVSGKRTGLGRSPGKKMTTAENV